MKYDLVGVDGNAFSIMGYTSNALKREGLGDLVDEMQDKKLKSIYKVEKELQVWKLLKCMEQQDCQPSFLI